MSPAVCRRRGEGGRERGGGREGERGGGRKRVYMNQPSHRDICDNLPISPTGPSAPALESHSTCERSSAVQSECSHWSGTNGFKGERSKGNTS